jgi:hypothetical protein
VFGVKTRPPSVPQGCVCASLRGGERWGGHPCCVLAGRLREAYSGSVRIEGVGVLNRLHARETGVTAPERRARRDVLALLGR